MAAFHGTTPNVLSHCASEAEACSGLFLEAIRKMDALFNLMGDDLEDETIRALIASCKEKRSAAEALSTHLTAIADSLQTTVRRFEDVDREIAGMFQNPG